MSINVINRIIYEQPLDTLNDFNDALSGFDAIEYNLELEGAIRKTWAAAKDKYLFLSKMTCGVAAYFLNPVHSSHEVEERIALFRTFSLGMEEKVKLIQRAITKKLYEKQTEIALKLRENQTPQFDSTIATVGSIARIWIRQGYPNLLEGIRGQIIWDRTKFLRQELIAQGYYVFMHAHSYPITLHLDLSSHFQSLHQSKEFKMHKGEESRRKFRAPGVARHFLNTTDYLKSDIGRLINSGSSMDDNHRESIISCDVIPDNNEAYESTQHFFKSNQSIVDTATSTGMKHVDFDTTFLKSYIKNAKLCKYAVGLFAEARQKLQAVAAYGMIRIIAIAKETLENPKTNYVWRSHAFGKLCTCRHTKGTFGHKEFVETLKRHHQGSYEHCMVGGKRALPQYRILAANLDRDPTKQIYAIDCLNTVEKKRSQEIITHLKNTLSNLICLEQLRSCKSVAEIAEILNRINLHETSLNYRQGVSEILAENNDLLEDHKAMLEQMLTKKMYDFLPFSRILEVMQEV